MAAAAAVTPRRPVYLGSTPPLPTTYRTVGQTDGTPRRTPLPYPNDAWDERALEFESFSSAFRSSNRAAAGNGRESSPPPVAAIPRSNQVGGVWRPPVTGPRVELPPPSWPAAERGLPAARAVF